MPIQTWSDQILLVELAEEPALTEDLQTLNHQIDNGPAKHVVLNMAGVRHMNSSHISLLLRLRAGLINKECQLRICNVPDMIWGVMLVTGLDKVFQFASDVPSALASLQLEGPGGQRHSARA